MVDQRAYRDALQLLSQYYRDDRLMKSLNEQQRTNMLAWLDGLAARVIFSTEHHLGPVHQVVAGESTADLAQRWNIPEQLLLNMNRPHLSSGPIPSGTELKQISGPFHATIDQQTGTMTLMLDDLYAGRFQVKMGISGEPGPGTYRVLVKEPEGHEWLDAKGQAFPPGDAGNHYGRYFIGLENFLCIHEVDESVQDGHYGCIGLIGREAADVFAILGNGSTVTIR